MAYWDWPSQDTQSKHTVICVHGLSRQGRDFHEDGLLLGVGARWYFADPWSISLDATRYDDNIRQLAVGFGWGLRRLGE
jgi:hypothetical protein